MSTCLSSPTSPVLLEQPDWRMLPTINIERKPRYLTRRNSKPISHFTSIQHSILINLRLRLRHSKISFLSRLLNTLPRNLPIIPPHKPTRMNLLLIILLRIPRLLQSLRIQKHVMTAMFPNHNRCVGKLFVEKLTIGFSFGEVGLDVEISD